MRTGLHRLISSATLAVALVVLPGTLRGQIPNPHVSPVLPIDVEIPAGHTGLPIAFFDDYSWKTFLALSWPAKEAVRGVPDPNKQLGESAQNLVWETWKSDADIFQPNGKAPSEWDSFASDLPFNLLPKQFAGSAKVLGSSTPVQTSIAHFNQVAFGQPSGTLIAQNQTYTRYEVRVNETEFNFIRSNKYYLAKHLPGVNDDPIVFETGSIEIKAAWHEFKLPEEQTLLQRYYTREAILVDHQGLNPRVATVGLIGLHIVHRTPSRPEWIWSTFEHVDNVDPPADIQPILRDPASSEPENRLEDVVGVSNPPKSTPRRTQVRRIRPIHDSTQMTNAKYRGDPKVRDTVWSNYQLVMTQWPINPARNEAEFKQRSHDEYPVGAGTPFPLEGAAPETAISNVTMETPTLIQRQFSCMNCHFRRANHNTEFVWFLRMRAFEPDASLVAEKKAKLLQLSVDSTSSAER